MKCDSTACPICHSDATHVYLRGISDSDDINVIECENCKMRFLDRIMSEEEEKEFYSDYYNNQSNRHHGPVSLKLIQERAFSQYMKYESFFCDLIRDKKSILEIGCGSGGFLRFINEHFDGKRIHAVDWSESNLLFLRDPLQNRFDNVEFYSDLSQIEGSKFDCVCAFGVLEHSRNPKEFLQQQASFLADYDSIVVDIVPNRDSTIGTFLNLPEFKKFEQCKMHYSVFSEDSLKLLAKETGLYVSEFKYWQVWGLDNAISWAVFREPHDFSCYSKVLSEETMNGFRKDMERNKTTDSLTIVFKKTK